MISKGLKRHLEPSIVGHKTYTDHCNTELNFHFYTSHFKDLNIVALLISLNVKIFA